MVRPKHPLTHAERVEIAKRAAATRRARYGGRSAVAEYNRKQREKAAQHNRNARDKAQKKNAKRYRKHAAQVEAARNATRRNQARLASQHRVATSRTGVTLVRQPDGTVKAVDRASLSQSSTIRARTVKVAARKIVKPKLVKPKLIKYRPKKTTTRKKR